MTKSLPTNPSLEHLKKEAKHILQAHRNGDASACETLRHLHHFKGKSNEEILRTKISLQEVQFALAREYGFRDWAELKRHVEDTENVPPEQIRIGTGPFKDEGLYLEWGKTTFQRLVENGLSPDDKGHRVGP